MKRSRWRPDSQRRSVSIVLACAHADGAVLISRAAQPPVNEARPSLTGNANAAVSRSS